MLHIVLTTTSLIPRKRERERERERERGYAREHVIRRHYSANSRHPYIHAKRNWKEGHFFLSFFILENPTFQKMYFVGLDKRGKPRLFQVLTRNTRPDSNSRSTVYMSNPLISYFVLYTSKIQNLRTNKI